MYKYILITALLIPIGLYGQDNTQKIQIEVKSAPNQQIEKPVLQTANEYVEFGKNLGGAFREGLSALTDEANKFADTDAGHFTMAIIAWKVAGDDAYRLLNRFIGVIVGIPCLIVLTSLYIWIMRKNFICHRVCIEKKGWLWWSERKYNLINATEDYKGTTQYGGNLTPSGSRFSGAFLVSAVYLIILNVILWNAII